jgi:hypothetical protein
VSEGPLTPGTTVVDRIPIFEASPGHHRGITAAAFSALLALTDTLICRDFAQGPGSSSLIPVSSTSSVIAFLVRDISSGWVEECTHPCTHPCDDPFGFVDKDVAVDVQRDG